MLRLLTCLCILFTFCCFVPVIDAQVAPADVKAAKMQQNPPVPPGISRNALRLSKDFDRAAELAARARQATTERSDARQELTACLEQGQDLLHTELGEAFAPVLTDVDTDGAIAAYERAVALAEQLGDEVSLASALRELAVISIGKVRTFVRDAVVAGQVAGLMQMIADYVESSNN